MNSDTIMESAENKLRKPVRDQNGASSLMEERTIEEDVRKPTRTTDFSNESVSPEASRALSNDETDVNKKLFNPIIKNNQYQVRKSAARALMDAALMMANISQMRTIIELGYENTHHYYAVLGLTIVSLVMQIVFAILMFVLLMTESEMAKKKDYLEHLQMLESRGLPKETVDSLKMAITNKKEDFEHELYSSRLNYATIFLVFVITVVNMFITGFGVRTKDE